MSVNIPSYSWIKTSAELASVCDELQQKPVLGLDTEFIRTNTFYPKTALLQVSTAEKIFLIDPLSINGFQPLRDLFANKQVLKVLHSCSEDLEVCKYFFSQLPQPIFDTQLAAAYVGYGFSMSYRALVHQVVGIDLPKEETRSDWLARPLSLQQERYAVLDVTYLLTLYAHLEELLKRKERLSWLLEDCNELIINAEQEPDPGQYYKKIKSAWKLNSKQLEVLRALSEWREITARELNKPRNHIVPEKLLWEIAGNLPRELEDIRKLMAGPMGRYKKHTRDMLLIINRVLESKGAAEIASLPGPLPAGSRQLIKRLKQCVDAVANELDVPVEILARKADLEFIARSGLQPGSFQLPPRLDGWRRAVVGDQLLEIANQFNTAQ